MGKKPNAYRKYFERIDEKRVKCTFCGHHFVGGGTRMQSHLEGVKGDGVKVCSQLIQFHQAESIQGSDERAKTIKTASVSGSNRSARTIETAPLNDSNKKAKTFASSSERGLRKHIEDMQVDEEKVEGLTCQIVDVEKETKQEELLTFNENRKDPCKVGPFSISHPVDEDDLKLIEYAFDLSLDPSEVIVSFTHFFLNRSEFTTLRPGCLLDGMLINVVAENLTNVEQKKQNRCWYLPISFSSCVSDDVSSIKEFVEKQKIRETYMSNLEDCHKIFIPVHIGPNSQGHFYLYVVDLRKEVVEIWDSLPSYTDVKKREEKARKILVALDGLFLNDIKDNYSEGWTFEKFNVEMVKDIPIQPNGYDCGMFVIKFMRSTAAMLHATSFKSDKERFTLARNLLKDDMNGRREVLLKNSKDSVLPSITEKLQCKKPGEFCATGLTAFDYGRLDQNMQLLKKGLKDLTSQENCMRKKLELGSFPGKKCKSVVENWLKNVDQRKKEVLGMEEGVKRLAEEVANLVNEKLPESLTANDHELSDDPLDTAELKSIYANLGSKKCFLYSAFYPENMKISREELISFFVDEGLISGMNSLEALFTEGHTILDELEKTCLFEGGSFDPEELYKKSGELDLDYKWLKGGIVDPEVKWVKICGASRALAFSIMNKSSGFMVEAGVELSKIPHLKKWADVEKVSLMCNLIKEIEIPWGTSLKCPKLLTLILQKNPLKRISDAFFYYMPALQILDLSYTDMKRLPKSISDLELLTSLLLRSCQHLEYVPPLGKLQRLMRLDLSQTAIMEVPEGLETLVDLRWLNLFKTRLLEMDRPESLIPKLINLQFLLLDCSSGFIKVKADDIKGLKKLETFAGNLYNAYHFNDYVKSMQAQDCRLKNYFLQLGTGNPWEPVFGKAVLFVNCNIMTREIILVLPMDVQQLYVAACQQWRCICDVFKYNSAASLKFCDIFECDNLENLFCFSYTCIFCNSLHNLESLKLSCLGNLRFLSKEKEAAAATLPPSSGILSGLRHLKISECDKMEKLFTPGLLANFQNLEKIHVTYCASMKEIFSVTDMEEMGEESSGGNHPGNNNSDLTTFFLPKLVSLVLWDLPELISVCRGRLACDCLQEFTIGVCPKLRTLPQTVNWVEIDVIP